MRSVQRRSGAGLACGRRAGGRAADRAGGAAGGRRADRPRPPRGARARGVRAAARRGAGRYLAVVLVAARPGSAGCARRWRSSAGSVLGPGRRLQGPRHGLPRGAEPALRPADRLALRRLAGRDGPRRLGDGLAARCSSWRPARPSSRCSCWSRSRCCGSRAWPSRHRGRGRPGGRRAGRALAGARRAATCGAPAGPLAVPRHRRRTSTGRSPGSRGELRDRREFLAAAQAGPAARRAGPEQLLTGLRGKDVAGRLRGELRPGGRWRTPRSRPASTRSSTAGNRRLEDDGLRQPQRLPDLAHVRRAQLAGARDAPVRPVGRQPAALRRAGDQSAADAEPAVRARRGGAPSACVPANNRDWPQGEFYGFDHVYDSRNVGYEGPRFGYPTMPDQYTLDAFHRLELAPAAAAAGDGGDRPDHQPRPVVADAADGRPGRRSATARSSTACPSSCRRRATSGPTPERVRAAYGDVDRVLADARSSAS